MARPKKPDARNYVYRVRLNEGENQQLTEASEWLDQSKSEVFRKALFDYHAKVKENKCPNPARIFQNGSSTIFLFIEF